MHVVSVIYEMWITNKATQVSSGLRQNCLFIKRKVEIIEKEYSYQVSLRVKIKNE